MAIGVNWKEVWKDVWKDVWAQTAPEPEPEPEAPQTTVAPTYGEFRLRDRRHEEFRKFLEEGAREKEDAKARALDRDRREAEAKEIAAHRGELERARARREAEVLKALRSKPFKGDYRRESLTGSAGVAPARPMGSLSGEFPVKGDIRASAAIRGILSGEHAVQGIAAPMPYLTGRAALEMEDDAIALALGMPELTEVLGEFVRI